AADLEAVEAGEHEVEDDDVGMLLPDQPERRPRLAGGETLEPLPLGVVAHEIDDVLLVVHDQHPGGHPARLYPGLRPHPVDRRRDRGVRFVRPSAPRATPKETQMSATPPKPTVEPKTADQALQTYIRPQTFPVAVRMLRPGEPIPE